MGGLARRATVLHQRQTNNQAFTLAGAYELSRPGRKASSSSLAVFGQVFSELGYDVLALSSTEADQLRNAIPDHKSKSLPSHWLQFSCKAQSAVVTHQGLRIGLILFPEEGPGQSLKESTQFEDVERSVQDLKSRCDLTIGLSPWGRFGEQKFLASRAAKPDILLGSGPGSAVSGKLSPSNRTLWMRPYSMGQAISVITIPNPQDKEWTKGWDIEANVHLEFVALDDTVPADHHIEELITSGSRDQE